MKKSNTFKDQIALTSTYHTLTPMVQIVLNDMTSHMNLKSHEPQATGTVKAGGSLEEMQEFILMDTHG